MWNVMLIVCMLTVYVDAISTKFTSKMAQSCKEHICRDGYDYDTVYNVDSEELKEIRKDAEMAFEMHIGIQGSSNGHILLSPVPKPSYNDPVYEIVIGGGGNSFTEIRRHLKRDAKSSKNTPNILSSVEIRGFSIKIDQEGMIEMFRDGETLPFISYHDLSPLEIKYFSFAAWSDVEVRFYYDCPISKKDGGKINANSQEVEKKISISDQLKKDILQYKHPSIAPRPTMDVRMGVKVTSAMYDAFESKLITTMSVVVSWTDDSMAWYPNKYNGTTNLKFRQGQIWRPKYYVFNSDDQLMFDTRNSELVSMVYSGEATFHFQTKVITWCFESQPGLSRWPHDEYECSIVIQPWEVHDKIALELINPTDFKMKIFSDIDDEVKNEWIVNSRQIIVKPSLWNDVYQTNDNVTHQSDRLIINVQLKRTATVYNTIFYTPLLVLVMFFLHSFWTEPLTMYRVWFLAGCVVVICMGLCYIDFLIPCHTVPSILILYIVVLSGILLTLMIQVILITMTMERICTSHPMQNIFTRQIFRFIFCLPAIKISANGGYAVQEDEEPSISRGIDVEEMESEKQRTYCDKRELAEVIDRVMFVVYSITFVGLLAAHY